MDYKQAYLKLFNTITDVIGELEKPKLLLKQLLSMIPKPKKKTLRKMSLNLTIILK